MEPFSIDDLTDRLAGSDDRVLEFLREDSMSLELYRLPAGATDHQEPHTEDEVYYVLEGVANIQIADDSYDVEPGDVIYVDRHVDHHFYDITEDLTTLIFFAPPFNSLGE